MQGKLFLLLLSFVFTVHTEFLKTEGVMHIHKNKHKNKNELMLGEGGGEVSRAEQGL